MPLIVAGPGIEEGQTTQSLANTVDIFATVLDISDIPLEDAKPKDKPFHSVSLKPILHDDANTQVRDFAYADAFGPSLGGGRDSRTIRNEEYKLIDHRLLDREEFYRLSSDPYEKINLLNRRMTPAAQQNYDELKAQMLELTGE